MRRAEIFTSLFFVVIGSIVIVDAVRVGFRWGSSGPEAGWFPFYLAVGTLICSAVITGKNLIRFKKEGPSSARLIPEGALTPILWVLLPSIGMVLLTQLVGLHVAAAVFLAFYMRAVGKIGWITVVPVSILTPLALYIVFDRLFLIPLPGGMLGSVKLIPF
jgi:hypothetical protein